MADSFPTEKKYIDLVKNQLINKFQYKNLDLWQQRDFENLSASIEEKTKINLSVSTLKRLWKNQFSNIPQKNTLNALAQFLDYKDWYEFKEKNKLEENEVILPKKVKRAKKKFPVKMVYIPASVVILVVVLFFIFKSTPVQSYVEADFSSRKNVSEGVPNTVIFDYNISKLDFDSAFIQQSWDIRRRAKISKNEMHSTSVYYFPGYHKAKLIINDQMVHEIPVYITTAGWLSLIQNPKNELIPIYVNDDCINNGQIHISTKQLLQKNIDLEANNHTTSFYYVNEDFTGDSNNFTFETRLKNSVEEGALVCQISHIGLLCEYGMHWFQFGNPGCVGKLSMGFANEMVSGKKHDLSAFGTNLNQWNKVKVEVKDKLVSMQLNENEIYKTHFKNDIGEIKGVYYQFEGCGAVDYTKLFNAENELVFVEDFE